MVSSTKILPAAMQFSPLLKKTDPNAILTERSRSKSPKPAKRVRSRTPERVPPTQFGDYEALHKEAMRSTVVTVIPTLLLSISLNDIKLFDDPIRHPYGSCWSCPQCAPL